MGTGIVRTVGILACWGGVFCSSAMAAAEGAPEPEPTLKETMASVARLAQEVKQIDSRLEAVRKSVAGLDQSLASIDRTLASVSQSLANVSAVVKPEGLNIIVTRATDVAFERAKTLILMVTACLAALIVLHAALRRWASGPRSAG